MSHDSSPAPPSDNEPTSNPPKKRTRVTSSQLNVLEETFALTATPDNKMRKQLAYKLQMSERSIQIWFQNRRAKVKMLQKRAMLREEQEIAKARMFAEAASHHPYWLAQHGFRPPQTAKLPIHRSWSSDIAPPPPPPPPLFPPPLAPPGVHMPPFATPFPNPVPVPVFSPWGAQDALQSMPGKDIPHHDPYPSASPSSTSLSSATPLPQAVQDVRFRRIESEPTQAVDHSLLLDTLPTLGLLKASAVTIGSWHRMRITQQDLLCYYDTSERLFSWHIRDAEYHFKMVISFTSIASIELVILPDAVSAQINMDLTEPPLFFMENSHGWIQCSDFTEGMQATCILRHAIRGLAADLRQELFAISSMDEGLCQVTRLSLEPTEIVGEPSAHEHPLMVPSQNWRHQSVPVVPTRHSAWTHSPF